MGTDRLILETFKYEENTIFHVETWLIHNGVVLSRKEIKEKILSFLRKGLLKIYEDPSNGQINFRDSSDEFEEDYWFVMTQEGKNKLNELS
ncbi:hypothetical protein N6H14_26100 [Paenibacillus sp. CC-CFT747]|nr:hypothetical protein N6H14_26100 [Paenibacillus sp. CC-CFT747]